MQEIKPRPGGLVDSIRRDIHDTAETVQDIPAETVVDQGYKALRVQPESPDVFGTRLLNIGPGQTVIALGNDPNRYRALITVVTPSGAAILSQNQGNAANGVGFEIGAGQPFLELRARGILWVNNPSTSETVQVAILSELYTDQH